MGAESHLRADCFYLQALPGHYLLLCSDGLTNMISDEEIALVLREVPFFEAPSILVDRALQAGGQDNITVLLMGVEITEVNHG